MVWCDPCSLPTLKNSDSYNFTLNGLKRERSVETIGRKSQGELDWNWEESARELEGKEAECSRAVLGHGREPAVKSASFPVSSCLPCLQKVLHLLLYISTLLSSFFKKFLILFFFVPSMSFFLRRLKLLKSTISRRKNYILSKCLLEAPPDV